MRRLLRFGSVLAIALLLIGSSPSPTLAGVGWWSSPPAFTASEAPSEPSLKTFNHALSLPSWEEVILTKLAIFLAF